jgi:hypothetical protein
MFLPCFAAAGELFQLLQAGGTASEAAAISLGVIPAKASRDPLIRQP